MNAKQSNEQLALRARKALFPNYGERDFALVRGEGCRCWDADGGEYLDMLSGIGVNSIGHSHPKVVEAIERQASELIHCSNIYLTEAQVELAERLVKATDLTKVFFCNSGTEATEAAIKLAKRWAHNKKGPGHDTVVVFKGSFHGRTFGSMSATWSPKVRKDFGPLVPGFVFADLNDLESVDKVWSEQVCGVLVETIQGEGGIIPCEREFFRGLRERCTERGALLMADEIQCGMGRSGKAFAYQHDDVKPDVVLSAKALAGGLPLGALIAAETVCDVLQPGSHGSTFGGNPVACAAANAVCEIVLEEDFLTKVGEKGCRWWGYLQRIHEEFSELVDSVRGLGLMQGLVLRDTGTDLIPIANRNGLLVHCTAGNVIRFLPPLTITKEELDEGYEKLRKSMKEFADTKSKK